MTQTRSWAEMLTWIEQRLVAATGDDVATWSARVRETGLTTEAEVRAWLAERGITGYGQMVLVMERFGYPDFLDRHRRRAGRRPVRGEAGAAAGVRGRRHGGARRGADVDVQARKGYVSLVTPRRTFAVVQASTRDRVDLGLRLPGREPAGRLLPARSIGNGDCSVRFGLTSVADVDDEVVDVLAEAYAANT